MSPPWFPMRLRWVPPVRVSFHRDTAYETFSEAPTVVQSPKSTRLSLDNDEKLKKTTNGVAFTTTNTIDTLTVDEQGETPLEAESPNPDLATASTVRKIALLTIFTLAEFLDAFNNSALFPAIPMITSELHFKASETVWIISAYQLTFAAFLLVVSNSITLTLSESTD
jgi:hypothetical protein